jgi:hypothetical protein
LHISSIYNTKGALKWCYKKQYLNTRLLDKYTANTTPMKRYAYDRDLRKEIPVETKKVDFQLFLDIVISSYLHNLN